MTRGRTVRVPTGASLSNNDVVALLEDLFKGPKSKLGKRAVGQSRKRNLIKKMRSTKKTEDGTAEDFTQQNQFSSLVTESVRDYFQNETLSRYYNPSLTNFDSRTVVVRKTAARSDLIKSIIMYSKENKVRITGSADPIIIYDKVPASYLIYVPHIDSDYETLVLVLWSEEGKKALDKVFSDIFTPFLATKANKVISEYYMAGGNLRKRQHPIHSNELPVIYKELYPNIDIDLLIEDYFASNDSILMLYGDPGTGKTSLIKKLMYSDHCRECLYIKDHDALKSGELWACIKDFDLIIFDDLDSDLSVSRSKSPQSKSFLSNILSYSDGVMHSKKRPKIVVSSNQNIEEIDSALIRPGRCFDFIHIEGLPRVLAKDLWIKFFKQPEAEFEKRFHSLKTISQSALMSEVIRITSDIKERTYILKGNRSYSIESKLLELGIRTTSAIEDKSKAGFTK